MPLFWIKYMNRSGTILSDVVPADTEEAALSVVREQVPGAHIFDVREHVPREPMKEQPQLLKSGCPLPISVMFGMRLLQRR